jgi:hypothetical protein
MNLILDIFGSIVIAAMLFMMIVKLELFSNQTSYTSDSELTVLRNTKTLAEIIDYDFRKVGYRYNSTAIITADSTEFEFYADIDSVGKVNDRVRYWAVASSKPGFIILKRTIDNGTSEMSGPSLGLEKIKFTFLDSMKTVIPYQSQYDKIKYIKTELWIKGDEPIPDAFADTSRSAVTYWEFTIYPRNI